MNLYNVYVQQKPVSTGSTAMFWTWVDGAFVQREMTNFRAVFELIGRTEAASAENALESAKHVWPEYGNRLAVEDVNDRIR